MGKKRHLQGESLEDLIALWTPSEIENYVGLVANAYRAFSADLAANPTVFTTLELDTYNQLYQAFLKWQGGNGFWSSLTIATVRVAEDYGKQLAYWRNLFIQKAGKSPTGPGTDIRVSPDKQLDTLKTMIVAGSVAVGLVAVAVIVVKFK